MFDPEVDFVETQEYREGIDWAVMHAPELAERYSSNNITADELRTYLWKVAGQAYPSKRGDMENDIRQTIWVAGAIRRIIDTLPFNLKSMSEVFDIAMDIGSAYGAEKWKYVHFLTLKDKDASWWRKKKGAASPNDVVGVLANAWWRKFSKEKGGGKTSKWEVLIDTLGTREMSAMASLKDIEYREDGQYKSYIVEGDDVDFQVMASPVYDMSSGRMILVQGMGDIVG